MDGRTIEIRDPGHHANNMMRKARLTTRAFTFDHSFPPGVSTADVYAKTTRFLVAGVMEGYNATVFAYGATGSGKTHTMLGNAASPGLMPSTLRDLWAAVQGYASTRTYSVVMTYVEIYNENVRDLLSAADEYLDLREDPVKVRRRVPCEARDLTRCSSRPPAPPAPMIRVNASRASPSTPSTTRTTS
jgi:kinesin family protein 18/19